MLQTEDWLLSCQSWKTDQMSIISPSGKEQRQWLRLVVNTAPPHSSAKNEQKENSSSQLFPRKIKSWSTCPIEQLLLGLPEVMASVLPVSES